jgi:hypothetical protein
MVIFYNSWAGRRSLRRRPWGGFDVTRKAIVVSLLALCLGCCLALADTIIDTTPSWDGTSGIGVYGDSPWTPTCGQTVTVPLTDTVLKSYTFQMWLDPTVIFRGEVYAWDGAEATGSGLWESLPMHTSANLAFEPVSFNTGGLPLAAGQQYVLFATTSEDPGSGHGLWGFTFADVYSGGGFAFLNADASHWTTGAWTQYVGNDLAFRADFGPAGPQVPEPGTMALLVMGIVGIVAKRRKR